MSLEQELLVRFLVSHPNGLNLGHGAGRLQNGKQVGVMWALARRDSSTVRRRML